MESDESMETKVEVMEEMPRRKCSKMLVFDTLKTNKTLNERFVRIKESIVQNKGSNDFTAINAINVNNDDKENIDPMSQRPSVSVTVVRSPPSKSISDDSILRQLAQNFKKRRNQNQILEEKKIFRSNVGHNRGLDVSFRPPKRFRSKTPVPTKLELDIDIDLYMSGAAEDLKEMNDLID